MLLPFSDAFSIGTTLGSRWTGSTWIISSGTAINTPTGGSELVTNGAFTSDTTGWTGSASATLSSVAGGQSGNCLQVAAAAANQYGYQAITTTAGVWYLFSGYLKHGTVGGALKVGDSADATQYGTQSSTASWAIAAYSFRPGATTTYITCRNNSSTGNALFDTISMKLATLSSLFASVEAGTGNVTADVDVTQGNLFAPAGLVVCLDSAATPANFLIAYLNKNTSGTQQCFLDKCLAGTFSNVIAGNVTYVAGATVRVVKNGTSVSLYYNGVQVGTTQTVSDAGIINNTKHGLFSTYGGNSLDNFFLSTPT